MLVAQGKKRWNLQMALAALATFGRTSSVRTAAGQAVDAWCQAETVQKL